MLEFGDFHRSGFAERFFFESMELRQSNQDQIKCNQFLSIIAPCINLVDIFEQYKSSLRLALDAQAFFGIFSTTSGPCKSSLGLSPSRKEKIAIQIVAGYFNHCTTN
jgi:hypothetical protein